MAAIYWKDLCSIDALISRYFYRTDSYTHFSLLFFIYLLYWQLISQLLLREKSYIK